MSKRKNILIAFIVLLMSAGVLEFSRIAAQRHVADQQKKVEDTNTIADETPTNDDPWKEVEKIVEAYYNKDGVNYKGTMKLIDGNSETSKVLEQMNFEYSLLGDEFYYKMGDFESVSKEDLLLVIDNQSKSISVAPQKVHQDQKALFNPDQFKKLLEQKSATAKITMEDNQKILTIDSIQDPTIQGYRIYYDPVSYQVKKMEIGMVRFSSLGDEADTELQSAEKSDEEDSYTYFLEVNYSEIRSLSLRKSEFHPENKFITVTNNSFQLTPAYHSYSLTNVGE